MLAHPFSVRLDIPIACPASVPHGNECWGRSQISMAALHRLVHQYIAETFPAFPAASVPSWRTLSRVWQEWFGPGRARGRYQRSAAAAEEAGVGRRLVVHRQGRVPGLGSTPLPLREGWGEDMKWPYPGVPGENPGQCVVAGAVER